MSKELYHALKTRGMLDYGSVIPGELVRELLGISYPEVGTKKDFDEVALVELAAVDYVRNILLGEGKYLAGQGDDYRVLLPSENKQQIERYMASADRKLRRAGKLSRSTPTPRHERDDNTAARIMLKRESIRNGRTGISDQRPSHIRNRRDGNDGLPQYA